VKPHSTGALVLAALAGTVALGLLCCRSAAVEAVYPAERAKTHFVRRVWSRVVGAFRGAAAQAENAQLRRELQSLALMRGDLSQLEAENARLRKALGYSERLRGEWVAAAVMTTGGGAAGARHTLRVDCGSQAGIRPGAVVVVPEGLVGRVVSVTPHTSEVLLITDSGLRFSCEVEVPGGVPVRGLLTGGDDTRLQLTHVRPDGVPIPPRARVITSGVVGERGFPRGLEVGSYLGKGAVEPSVDYAALEDVFIRRGE